MWNHSWNYAWNHSWNHLRHYAWHRLLNAAAPETKLQNLLLQSNRTPTLFKITSAPVAILIALPISPFLLGIQQCTAEVCDGVDNDGDGQIDENYDIDGDGYYSELDCDDGTDCDDLDPLVHPDAAEYQDGNDNDCDGIVDEISTYVLTFKDSISGNVASGLPVWLGRDGNGPVFTTNASGQITFDSYNPVQDLNFSFSATLSFVDDTGSEINYLLQAIDSSLNRPLSTQETIDVIVDSTETIHSVNGTASGLDPAISDVFQAGLGGPLGMVTQTRNFVGLTATFTTFGLGNKNFLYAAQLYDTTTTLPYRFNIVLDPVDPTNITLTRSLEQITSMSWNGGDARITSNTISAEITLPNGYGSFTYSDRGIVAQSGVETIEMPTLSGVLEGASVTNCILLSERESGLQQSGCETASSILTEADFDLLTVPTVMQQEFVDRTNIEGTSLTVTADGRTNRILAWYWDIVELDTDTCPDGSSDCPLYIEGDWQVHQYDVEDEVVFPEIPASVSTWLSQPIPAGYIPYATGGVVETHEFESTSDLFSSVPILTSSYGVAAKTEPIPAMRRRHSSLPVQ